MIMLPPSLPDSVDWSQPVNWNHSLNWGLRAWWIAAPRFRGGVTWRDLCGKNHGTLQGMTPATAWQPTSRPGGWGQLAFDGSDDYVEVDDPISPAGFSVSVWARFDDTSTSSALIGSYDNTTNERSWYFGMPGFSGGKIEFGFSSNGSDFDFRGYVFTDTTTWHHFVAVYDGGTGVAIYQDGRPKSLSQGGKSGTPSSLHQGTSPTRIGAVAAQSSSPNYFDGQLDDIRLYDRALSATEVRDLYGLSKQHYPGMLNRVELPWYAAAPAGGSFIDNTSPILRHIWGAA